MTSLHYTLIALGIGLVAAVMLYNLYQERRSRRQAERLFDLRDRVEEVSLDDLPLHDALPETRIEPHIPLVEEADRREEGPEVNEEVPVAPEPMPESYAREEEEPTPVAAPEPEAETAPAARPHRLAPESPLDGDIEYVARLRYAQPTVIQFATLLDSLRRISKPIRMVGRRADGVWETVSGHAAQPYDTVELGLLLADRSGPVSEVQLDTFCRRLYDFASEHGGAVSCQDKNEAIERAKDLDGFCAEVDMLIGLNVVPADQTELSARDVSSLALRAGLIQGPDGTFSLKDEAGRLLFTMADGDVDTAESSHGIVLLFDVPRVPDGLAAFDRMTELGLLLAEALQARLVDDGGRPVSRGSLMRDRGSLETIYARMHARGIPAGGDRALRLFA